MLQFIKQLQWRATKTTLENMKFFSTIFSWCMVATIFNVPTIISTNRTSLALSGKQNKYIVITN